MEGPMPNWLRTLFLVHLIVALVSGALFYLIPGRTLTTLGWVERQVKLPDSELTIPGGTFVDPVITRILGAALLALAYSSFRGWRSTNKKEVQFLVQLEAAFCVLSVGAFVAGLLFWERTMPFAGWMFALLFAGFGAAWLWALWPRRAG